MDCSQDQDFALSFAFEFEFLLCDPRASNPFLLARAVSLGNVLANGIDGALGDHVVVSCMDKSIRWSVGFRVESHPSAHDKFDF